MNTRKIPGFDMNVSPRAVWCCYSFGFETSVEKSPCTKIDCMENRFRASIFTN